jgi:RsiW-degrading membrane proteinase PrsW (M82 family)
VVAAAVVVVPVVAFAAATAPQSVLLALVPLAIVVPALIWLDRVEPEPWSSRVHAALWGATVAVVVAGVVNSVVAVAVGEVAAAVVSAPLVEETMKGLGVYWAVRRREVDGVIDGLVYASWVGLGFAAVENVQYFWVASDEGVLAETFVLRALLTPFAHPLFTAWIGLAIGTAIAAGRPLVPRVLLGWLVSVGLHALWNGSLVAASETGTPALVGLAAIVFLAVFGGTIVMVVMVRRRERERFLAAVPHLAAAYGVSAADAALFAGWRTMLQARRRLPATERRRFDDLHATLARLAALHHRRAAIDPVAEARLVAHLRAIGPSSRRPAP